MKSRNKAGSILITGATSGIGEALALEYAKRGVEKIFICGRDQGRLDSVMSRCRELGSDVYGSIVDVRDADKMEKWIRECDAVSPLELIIANAGVGSGGDETEESIRNTFEINVNGVINTVLPAIEIFLKNDTSNCSRKRKQIVINSSLTGYHGLPTCPAYSASKACVKAWGAALRGKYRNKNIMINTICPGFVRSRLTDKNEFRMPFFMEADKAARIIISRLERNIGLITFPTPMRFVTWLVACLPDFISERIYRIINVEL